MTNSRESHRANDASPLSLSTSTSPSDADQDTSLSTSNKATQSSLKSLNDYIQNHYEQFAARESLERGRLVASFAEKEQSYERHISTLKAIHADIAGLLGREQTTNNELREKLDNATSFITRLCKVVADASFVFVDSKRGPHEIKQEEGSQENIMISDIIICPNATVSSLLSQIESVVTEMNAQNGAGLPSPIDTSPCHSIIEALGKVLDSLLATQRTFALLQEDIKSVNAARVDTEFQNQSLREKVALLQEELKQTRSDNERISQELAAARLEKENHICRPPVSAHSIPTVRDNFPASLPSPPLENRDLCIPDDILQDTRKIGRKTNQTFLNRVLPENTSIPPQASIVEAGPSSASTSTSYERRRISLGDAVKRVQANTVSSMIPAMQSGPTKSPVVHNDLQTAGPSLLPPHTPVQGIKRTSSGVHKCQNVSKGPPPALLTSPPASSSISDKMNDVRPQKKRRLNGTSDTHKHNFTNKNPRTMANATHASTTSTTDPPSASSSKHAAVQLPKTSASDLKSLKFNRKSQSGKQPPTPTMKTSPSAQKSIATPTKSDRLSMKPLDLAKKSPQERAALRKSK